MDRSTTGEPDDGRYAVTSSKFLDTRIYCLINTIQKLEGIIIGKNYRASYYNRHNFFLHFHTANIFNLCSYPNAGIVVDARELSDGAKAIVVVKQAINNYNHYRANRNLTSTTPKHPLSA
ncbi:hypothetical protein PVK06_019165 [Gossypium arboreum]|uniref:Uncharacterized protein n=1 Tax=Gossypium arboreum TaxID=29729 RepID=A0ABR0PJ04_GOSAR|nr:hypothetical protein PVK06_019165 [Gossypium arboreum]